MKHVVIVAWTAENRVAKYQDYPTEAQCQSHISRVKGTWPDAFHTTAPSDAARDWRVDPIAQTLSIDPALSPARVPGGVAVIEDALLTVGVISKADLDAAKTKLSG